MKDRTRIALRRQLTAMGAPAYDIAIGRTDCWRIVLEVVPPARVLVELRKLRRHNARYWGVHVRPCEPHGLVFVDDVESGVWKRMISQGFEPAAIIQSSPGSHQLWLRHAAPVPPADRKLLAKWLTKRAGGDFSGAASSHWGRLAGFTNRKPEHLNRAGQFPFVLVDRASGKVYAEANRVLSQILPRLRAEEAAARTEQEKNPLPRFALRPLEEFWHDKRYDGDLHPSELSWVHHARRCGLSKREAWQILRHGRDLSKKGSVRRQDEYATRTIEKVYGEKR